MSSDNDGLTEHLLFQIALTGSKGLGAADFAKHVGDYVHTTSQDDEDGQDLNAWDQLFSTKPPKQRVVLDSTYLESAWSWMISLKDVFENSTPEAPPSSELHALDDKALDQYSQFLNGYAHVTICATEDRIWQTVAGHGVDWRRLPKLQFQCLCVIAAHGPQGVLQPDVVALTGQDKRSVPKRTDTLAENGYITKEPCQGGGSKTSLLKLKKFANQALSSDSITRLASTTARVKDGDNMAAVIRYDQWWDIITERLLEAEGNVVLYKDLSQAIGALGSKIGTRALNRFAWRLVEIGLIRRLGATSDDVDHAGDPLDTRTRYIKLLRPPTSNDKDLFMTFLKKGTLEKADGTNAAEGLIDEEVSKSNLLLDDELMDDAMLDNAKSSLLDSSLSMDLASSENESLKQSPPVWSPELSISNIIFEVVASFGPRGASSQEVCEAIGTSLYRKPFDEMALRLTDQWHKTQPPHLRHLSIIRDTRMSGLVTEFVFRTLRSYQLAVSLHLSSWDYILNDEIIATVNETSDLDRWGFPKLPMSEFYKRKGSSAITRCARSVRLPPARGGLMKRSFIVESTNHRSERKPDVPRATAAVKTGRKKKKQRTPLKEHPSLLAHKQGIWTRRYDNLVRDWESRARFQATIQANRELTEMETRQDFSDQNAGADLTSRLAADPSPDSMTRLRVRKRTQRGPESPEVAARKRMRTSSDDGEMARRIDDLTREIISLSRPGVYLNEPRASLLARDTSSANALGRPKDSFILTFKSSRLTGFPWFTFDKSARASRRLLDFVPALANDLYVVVDPQVPPSQSTRSASSTEDDDDDEIELATEQPRSEPASRSTMLSRLSHRSDLADGRKPALILVFKLRGLHSLPWFVDGAAVDNGMGERPKSQASARDVLSDLPKREESEIDDRMSSARTSMMDDLRLPSPATPRAALPDAVQMSSGLRMFDMVSRSNNKKKHRETFQKRQGVTRSTGSVDFERAKVILDIIDKCGGVFPGCTELYYPFVAVWQPRYQQHPDRVTLNRCVKRLVATGKLMRATFSFRALEGYNVRKYLLLDPDIDPEGPLSKRTQRLVQSSWPAIYIPPEAPLTEEVQIKLEERKELAAVHVKAYQRLQQLENETSGMQSSFQAQMNLDDSSLQRQQRDIEARLKSQLNYVGMDALSKDAQQMTSAFQLTGYQFNPEDSYVDRGPHGRRRVWQEVSLGGTRPRQQSTSALQNLRGLLGKRNTLDQAPSFLVAMMRAQQPFSEQTGTFGTIFSRVAADGRLQTPRTLSLKRLARGDRHGQTLSASGPEVKGRIPVPRMTYGAFKAHHSKKRGREEARTSLSELDDGVHNAFHRKAALEGHYRETKRPKINRTDAWAGIDAFDLSMTEDDRIRVFYAIAIVKTLAGGLQQGLRTINFGMVSQALHFKYDGNYFRSFWNHTKGKEVAFVDYLQDQFRELFLSAFEAGELPDLSLASPEKIDWAHLVDWTRKKLEQGTKQDLILPSTREELQGSYSIDLQDGPYVPDMEAFWAVDMVPMQRDELVDAHPYFDPLLSTFDEAKHGNRDSSNDLLAQSWIRADLQSPSQLHDAKNANLRLRSFSRDAVEQARERMLSQGLIKHEELGEREGTPADGQTNVTLDTLETAFPVPPHWELDLFHDAVTFKLQLDDALSTSFSYELLADDSDSDGRAMAVLNLVAQGHVELDVDLPPIDHSLTSTAPRALSKWGFQPGQYRFSESDLDALTFPLRISPTASYTPGALRGPTQPDAPLRTVAIEMGKTFEEDRHSPGLPRLPYWVNIDGQLNPEAFRELVLRVALVLAQRPGLNVEQLAEIFRGRVWAWEVEILAEWAEKVGLLRKDEGGWALGEWWWLLVAALPE